MYIMFTINKLKVIRMKSSYGGLFIISLDSNSLSVVPVSINTNKAYRKIIQEYRNFSEHLQDTTFIGYIKISEPNNGVLLTSTLQKMIYEDKVELNITHYADYFYINGDKNNTDHKQIIDKVVKIKYKGTIDNINIDTIFRDIKIYDILS